MVSIIDFMDEPGLEERAEFVLDNGKFIGRRKEGNSTIKLFSLFDHFIEGFFNEENEIVKFELMKSQSVIDQYIDIILEDKDWQEKHFHFVFNNLKEADFFSQYKKVYFPKDDWNALYSRDTQIAQTRLVEYKLRQSGVPQETLNVYLKLTDMVNMGRLAKGIKYLPEYPGKYEKNGDRYIVLSFEGSDFRFIKGEIFEWQIEDGQDKPILIWESINQSNEFVKPNVYKLVEEQKEIERKIKEERHIRVLDSLFDLRTIGRLKPYKKLYMPMDSKGALTFGDINILPIEKVGEFQERKRFGKQKTLNIYLVFKNYQDKGEKLVLPASPSKYERNGDVFFTVEFTGSKYKYSSSKLNKWKRKRAYEEDSKVIWSDE